MSIGVMRYESSVTSLSWIPSEAVTGVSRAAFDSGFTHYDDPPPGEITDLAELQAADRFRFGNLLRAWIDVDDSGRITDGGYSGGGLMGATTLKLAGLRHTFQAVSLPDLQRPPERGETWMRFVQTTGGRTAIPAPRPVRRRPFIQWQAPLVWTTLSLTLHADGRAEYEVTGASRFPRHWIYDDGGKLGHKSGLTDYANWARVSFGRHTPWGDEDSPALVTAVETALEQSLSVQLMHGAAKPRISNLEPGAELVRQGDFGQDVFLVLDGVIRVEHDGERLAEVGPGAMLGERAALESGSRTATLVAVTKCRVAAVPAVQLDLSDLAELATGHRREEGVRG
jgi:cyclic nucleotide-binding protein